MWRGRNIGFFDTLNEILGGSKASGLGGSGYLAGNQGGGFGPDSRELGPLQGPTQSPYSQNYEDIVSINRVSEMPFKVFDITPYYVPAASFPCMYSRNVLRDLIGPELGAFFFNPAVVIIDEPNPTPYFRTVPITVNGNFLKIEFLPNRIHEVDTWPPGIASNPNFENLDTSVDASFVNPTLGYTPSSNVPYWDAIGGAEYAAFALQSQQSKSIVLLSFDSQQAIPLIAEHGSVFKCAFNTVFVTFKTGSSRIRVTTGYNSEIESQSVDRSANTSLSHATGNGFLSKQLLHYEPFCVTEADANAASTRNILASTATVFTLVAPMNFGGATATRKKGVGCLWLTGISGTMDITTASLLGTRHNLRYTLAITDTSDVLRRLVWRGNMTCVPNSSGAVRRDTDIVWNIPTPIRVSLHENEQLVIKVNNTSLDAIDFSYTITGYTYGRWRFDDGDDATPQIPIILMDLMTEHPYFLDNFKTIGLDGADFAVI